MRMPTTRPRHLITETDQVARALDDAALQWPDLAESRAKLLVRLLEEGHRTVIDGRERRLTARRTSIRAGAGVFDGLYPENYLEELRQDWPE
jgi:hypothetical protein